MDDNLELIIEAIIFSSDHPVTIKELLSVLNEYTYNDIRTALENLTLRYQTLKRSFHLVEVAEGYQFRTKKEFSPYVQKLYLSSPYKLSTAAMETLAIIAYRQPISKLEIENIRGVDCSHTIKVLVEKGLVRVVGRKDIIGRPLLYGTTRRFLEVFGLKDISLLPEVEDITKSDTSAKTGLESKEEREHERID
jgi:segregation and condensation protein B